MNIRLITLLAIFLILSLAYPVVSVSPESLVNGNPDSLSPFNRDFIAYLENMKGGSLIFSPGVNNHLGYVPPSVDLSYLQGQQIGSSSKDSLIVEERSVLFDGLKQQYSPPAETPGTTGFDLRAEGRTTPARDQGTCGCCWAFSTLASLESTILPGRVESFSVNNMKNSHGYDLSPCQGGNALMSTAYLARWSGPVSDTSDPYSGAQGSTPAVIPNPAAQYHVQEVLFVPGRSSPTDNQNIKKMLKDYGAVYSSICWEESSYRPSTNAYFYSGISPANHAITIVGWDDTYDKNKFVTTPPGNGAFIVKNSWGTNWGENGYFFVSYYDRQIGLDNAVFIGESSSNYYHIYQYDPLGWVASYGDTGNTAYFANVFTALADEDITAIAFYTPSLNSQYKISLYKGVGNTPVSGLAQSSRSGTIGIPGYHTITLSQPVRVKKGERFSVVVKLTTPGNNFPVAIEYQYPGFSSRATASTGESFVSSDGISWTEFTNIYANSNVCLKAFSTLPGQVSQTPSPPPTTPPAPAPTPPQGDSILPSVIITSPVPYTTVSPRENLVITWSASDNVGVASVSLQYSLNGGTSWNPIAENQPQAGSYTWAIPEGSATTLNIKVIAKDRAGNCGSQTRVVFLKNFADKKYTPGRIGTTVTYPGPSQKEALLRELSK